MGVLSHIVVFKTLDGKPVSQKWCFLEEIGTSMEKYFQKCIDFSLLSLHLINWQKNPLAFDEFLPNHACSEDLLSHGTCNVGDPCNRVLSRPDAVGPRCGQMDFLVISLDGSNL